jgi:hypothetical protein
LINIFSRTHSTCWLVYGRPILNTLQILKYVIGIRWFINWFLWDRIITIAYCYTYFVMYHICILFLQLHFESLFIKKIICFGWALWICLKVRCVVPYKLSWFMFTISFIYLNHVHWGIFINIWEIVILAVLLWILCLLVLLSFIVYSYIWYRLLIKLVSLKRFFLLQVSLMIFCFCQLRFCLFYFLDICLKSLLLL